MAVNNKKFNLTELLNQRSKETTPSRQQEVTGVEKTASDTEHMMIDVYDLIPSEDNFYSVDDVQDLKQSIELLGVLQPLLVTEEDENGKRHIIAGHRRRLAIMQLVSEGKERFRRVPVVVKPTENDILDRLALIMTNRFREKTDWEKMTECIETEKLVQGLKKQMNIPGRTRDLLAEIIETSPAQLGKYKAIYNNLAAELMRVFKDGKIGVSVAYELSQLEKEWQLKSLKLLQQNGTLTLPDIKGIKQQKETALQTSGQTKLDTMKEHHTLQMNTKAKGEENSKDDIKMTGKLKKRPSEYKKLQMEKETRDLLSQEKMETVMKNIGDGNSSNKNIGDKNSGEWNKTNYSNGCFNTIKPKIYLFNKPSRWTYEDWVSSDARWILSTMPDGIEYVDWDDMTDEEKAAYPEAEVTGGYLREYDRSERANEWWRSLNKTKKDIIKSIPNFDREIFKEITGIDVD